MIYLRLRSLAYQNGKLSQLYSGSFIKKRIFLFSFLAYRVYKRMIYINTLDHLTSFHIVSGEKRWLMITLVRDYLLHI